MSVSFYDVKTRQQVEVPDAELSKTSFTRVTNAGQPQTRYALRAKYDGRNLTRFVNKAVWDACDGPVV